EHYMAQSEQLQTRIWLEANPQAAAGLLLQQLPLSGGNAPTATDGETWNRSQQLAGTLQPGELLATDSETLIHRLFWEEDLLVFEPQAARFHCGCDREKVVDVLRLLGQPEIDSILAEQDEVTVNCDYCTREYAFDRVDCAEIFASDAPAGLRHQSPSQH